MPISYHSNDEMYLARLKTAVTGKDLNLKRDKKTLKSNIEYLDESKPWRSSLDTADTELESYASPVLLERLAMDLSMLAPSPSIEKIRAALASENPAISEKGFRALKAYFLTHPADELTSPTFRAVSALPDGFFFHYRNTQDEHLGAGVQAKILNVSLPSNLKTCNIFASLAVGQLVAASSLERMLKEQTKGEHSNLDLSSFIDLFKATTNIYGKDWETHDAERLRLLRKQMIRLEWKEKNPVFTTPEAQAALQGIKDLEHQLSVVSGETINNRKVFAWPFFLQQVWEQETELHDLLVSYPYNAYDMYSEESRDIVKDKKNDPALEALGEKLLPFADQSQRTKKMTDADWKQHVARDAISKNGFPSDPDLAKPFSRDLREIQWQAISAFKQQLVGLVAQPNLFDQALKLEVGFFRDFLLSEAWNKEPKKTRKLAEEYLSHMQKEVPDAAKANRAPDILNRYVRNNYQEGTESSKANQDRTIERAIPRIFYQGSTIPNPGDPQKSITPNDVRQDDTLFNRHRSFRDLSLMPAGGFVRWDAERKRTHREAKAEQRELATQENFPAVKDLYLFSETVAKNQSSAVVLNEPSYATRLAVEVAQSDMRALQSAGEKTADTTHLENWVTKHIPDACAFRDFFLENAIHVRLWNHLRASRLGPRLAELGIHLEQRDIDLTKQLAGKDEGTLQDAYLTSYTVLRVEGLAAHISVFTPDEQGAIADVLRQVVPSLTPAAAEVYDRIMVELEAERLRTFYQDTYQHALPASESLKPQHKAAARAKAFDAVFVRIVDGFPLASYNRDELLERFALDYATTPDQARRVEEATYDFLVRRPDVEKKKGEKVIFGPAEAVKNYLSAFSDRQSRAKIIGWVFNGELPDDRYLESRTFQVNADQEREAFWLMSHSERKVVLYNALLGEHGIFELPPSDSPRWYYDGYQEEIMNEFLKDFFKNNFEKLLEKEPPDSHMSTTIKTVFFETFKNYSAPRRVELFLSLTRKMHELRQKNQQLTTGQAMRVFLEQVGVVGIKVGQVLSEREDMVSDEKMRSELSSLRDRATPFAKYGVFTYLRMAGLFTGAPAASTAPFRIAEVGECLGSASIKQAHLAITTGGEEVVVKLPRPTIDKNYQEDLAVLRRVMETLRSQGIDVPEHLLTEVADACETEFDFGMEATAQNDVEAALHRRTASVETPGGRITLNAPKLAYILRKGENKVRNLQLMVDEYIPGLNLGEVDEYRRLSDTPDLAADPEKQARHEKLRRKIEQIYGERFPLAEKFYLTVPLEDIRAQLGIDLMTQIATDGAFHADAHAGNIIVNAAPKAERVTFIDFGSVGRSVEVSADGVKDHRPAFRDFLRGLLLQKIGMGDSGAMGQIIQDFVQVEGCDAKFWAEKVATISAEQKDVAGFFKSLLGEMLSRKARINRQFKLLLKSMAAGGSHFDALSKILTASFQDAMARSMQQGKPVGELLLQDPRLRGLKTFIDADPVLKGMLGLA